MNNPRRVLANVDTRFQQLGVEVASRVERDAVVGPARQHELEIDASHGGQLHGDQNRFVRDEVGGRYRDLVLTPDDGAEEEAMDGLCASVGTARDDGNGRISALRRLAWKVGDLIERRFRREGPVLKED